MNTRLLSSPVLMVLVALHMYHASSPLCTLCKVSSLVLVVLVFHCEESIRLLSLYLYQEYLFGTGLASVEQVNVRDFPTLTLLSSLGMEMVVFLGPSGRNT